MKSKTKLDKEGMKSLKKAWNDYYNGNSSCVILNEGMEFQDASNTSVENQLNEKNKTFSDEVKELFHTNKNNEEFIRNAVMPIATAFCTALNRDFLLESEKDFYYFAPDYTELIRCTIKERFEAYQIAITSGFKTRNEVRYLEGDDALDGLDMINIGLGDVLFDPKTKQIYTPNTNKMMKMDDMNQEIKQIETTSNEENNENEQKASKEMEGGEQIE